MVNTYSIVMNKYYSLLIRFFQRMRIYITVLHFAELKMIAVQISDNSTF